MAPPGRTRPPIKPKPSPWKKTLAFLRKNAPNPSSLIRLTKETFLDPAKPDVVMVLLIFFEIVVNVLIVTRVPYTEIDWKAYMQEVEGFWNGTRDYEKLRGDTGPLVYPAGFVYVFLGLYHLTAKGADVRLAQWLFAALYLLFILAVFRVYRRCKTVPPYAFVFMCCTSYRIHSLFALRLFNDPVAMFLFYLALNCMLDDRWTIACSLYSLAVSVKMNVLLFAPGMGIVLLSRRGWRRAFLLLALCLGIQLLLGLPFLLENPQGYLLRSFEVSRQFLYQWTVNWRCIPEWLFLDRNFQLLLLTAHVSLLLVFAHFRWTASPLLPRGGGILSFLRDPAKIILDDSRLLSIVLTSNFIGMTFARSLHYQFYVWYYHGLYFLLWRGGGAWGSGLRLLILGCVELAWNTYPSTPFSSNVLHLCHGLVLVLLFQREERTRVTRLCPEHYEKIEREIKTALEKKNNKKSE